MHTRLVDQHVRLLAHAIGHVLHAAGAPDARLVGGIRIPERRLVDPHGLALHLLAEAEGLEHLHGPHIDAVRLTLFHARELRLDDHRPDARHARKLRGQTKACRAASSNQDVHLRWDRRCTDRGAGSCGKHVRITGHKAVEMILHDASSCSGLRKSRDGIAKPIYTVY